MNRYSALIARASRTPLDLPSTYRNTTVVFVGGLLSEWVPGYFRPNMEATSRLGLSHERVSIDSRLSTEQNAASVRRAALRAPQRGNRVLFFGHSLGNRDIERALEDRSVRQVSVGWIAAQAGFSGMPLAAKVERSSIFGAVFGLGMGLLGGNMRAVCENTPGYRERQGLRCAPSGLVVTTLGTTGDEFIGAQACKLPGALCVTLPRLRHVQTVTSPRAVPMTQALIVLTLEEAARREGPGEGSNREYLEQGGDRLAG